MTDDNIWQQLRQPFPAEQVNWRISHTNDDDTRGLVLAYIDARAVMERLDTVVGPGRWWDEYDYGPNGQVLCRLTLRVDDETLTKMDGAEETNIEAVKGGISDAFKRAAVKFGIGRYLYHLDSKWVQLNKYKQPKQTPNLPSWARPDGEQNAGGRADSPSSQSQPDSQDSQGSPPSGESAPRTATDKQLERLKQLESALWVVDGKVEKPGGEQALEVLENSVLSDLEEGAGKPPSEWPQGAVGQRIGKLKQKAEVVSVLEDLYPEVDTSGW